MNLSCKDLLRIFIVQCGSESTSKWCSLVEMEARSMQLSLRNEIKGKQTESNLPG